MRVFCVSAFVVFALVGFGQTKVWTADQALDAAQVISRLTEVQLTSAQLEKLQSKAKLVKKAKADSEQKRQSILSREKDRLNDITDHILTGKKLTDAQVQRVANVRNEIRQLDDELEGQISAIIADAVSILTEEQQKKMSEGGGAKQEAMNFLNQIRSVPDAQWNQFSRRAFGELIRADMMNSIAQLRSTGGGSGGGNRGDRQNRDEMRTMMDAARKTAEDKLQYYRTMPQSNYNNAVDEIIASRQGTRGQDRLGAEFIRDVITPDAASDAIAAYQSSKVANKSAG
jgi:hypothetical protein